MTSQNRLSAAAWTMVLFAMLVLWMTSSAQAMPDGKAIVVKHCSNCHATGMEDASPLPLAPAFRVLAKRYKPEQLEEALAEGIVVGHPLMPEFVFEPEDIAAIVAWLEGLAARSN